MDENDSYVWSDIEILLTEPETTRRRNLEADKRRNLSDNTKFISGYWENWKGPI